MSVAIIQPECGLPLGTMRWPHALHARWYDPDPQGTNVEGVSPERWRLGVKAAEALRHARSFTVEGDAAGAGDDAEYVLPPLMVQRTIRARVRWLAPLSAPTLDIDDLPL